MLKALSRVLQFSQDTPPLPLTTLSQIVARLDELESREIERNAEHMAMCDRLDRLYKRLSARISRQDAPGRENGSGVSPLAFRDEVNRQRSRNGL